MLFMGVGMTAEMAYLMYQAALAEPSHDNYSTPFHTFMCTVVLFAGALTLVSGVAICAYVAEKHTAVDLSRGQRTGVVWGFALSFVMTGVLATYVSGSAKPLCRDIAAATDTSAVRAQDSAPTALITGASSGLIVSASRDAQF